MLGTPYSCGNGGWLVLIANVVLIFGPMPMLWQFSFRFKLLWQITTIFHRMMEMPQILGSTYSVFSRAWNITFWCYFRHTEASAKKPCLHDFLYRRSKRRAMTESYRDISENYRYATENHRFSDVGSRDARYFALCPRCAASNEIFSVIPYLRWAVH